MRFGCRLAAVALGCTFVLLLVLGLHQVPNAEVDDNGSILIGDLDEYEDQNIKDDIAAQLLLHSDIQNEGSTEYPGGRPPLSISVAIVITVCLISVALLITGLAFSSESDLAAGIIVVALTIDPTTSANSETSDLEDDDDDRYDDDEMRNLVMFAAPPAYFSTKQFDALFSNESSSSHVRPSTSTI